MPKKDGKPRGRMSSYAFFVQTCREEHKKKHPGETVVFAEFTKKCASKWKDMTPKEKRRFEEMAEKDKQRYENEMAMYSPGPGGSTSRKGKRTKDPNAPKRALSAFFFFCADERPNIRKENPAFSVADVAKKLGKMWEVCPNKPKYEAQAAADKKRYEAQMAAYKAGGASAVQQMAASPKKQRVVQEEDDDDDEEDDDEEDDDDDDE
ncbi:hypothetical protein FSP39_005699 [Pinctada imbricata]|uniref:HMG box domain-containing protein n=2 Tax=Pinctada TaxID=50425 RepID=A0AA88Y6J2_PINIB|nr:hypothetical protein FSP39_005699 [Pinctada imbricata]